MTEPSRETPPEAAEPAPGEDEATTERPVEGADGGEARAGAADAPTEADADDAASAMGAASTQDEPADADADTEADGEAAAEGGEAKAAAELSEAQAELAAQRELRARIERRKAEKEGPVAAGTKLSGKAADLLAAVRAVESGTKSVGALLDAPEPESRRPAPAAAPVTTVRPAPVERAAASAETLAAVRDVLARGGAPESLTGQVATVFGEGAAEALREDPWQLLSVPGVQPEHADGFARALLGAECGPGDPRRAVALVAWLLERAALKGHTALEDTDVRAGLAKLSVPDPEEAVQQAISEGAVLVFQEEEGQVAEEHSEDDEEAAPEEADIPVLLGLDRYALAEESLADGLARLAKTVTADDWEGPELVRAAGAHGLVAHTGGEAARSEPVALAEAARARGLRVAVAAHSENGVRRLRSLAPADPGAAPAAAVDRAEASEAAASTGSAGGTPARTW